MITIITGTPGAGKTLYAIDKLLSPLLGTTVKQTLDDGQVVELPRTIYTNINGLQVEHELIQADTEEGLHNWHNWAKPGSVIVVDEFQRMWPPRPNGAKVPDDISALDTHRHKGVDFILITQNVMNVDRHVHGLCNRHLHVRRMANMGLAIVYEWDHCSRQLMYAKALTRSPYRYNRAVFKLYKSADLHTKQPRSLPGVVWFIAAALVGLVVLGPTAKARLEERISGKAPGQVAAVPKGPAGTAVAGLPGPVQPKASPALPTASSVPLPVAAAASAPAPEPMGCGMVRSVCRCFDRQGVPVKVEPEVCLARFEPAADLQQPGRELPHFQAEGVQLPQMREGDAEALAFLFKKRHAGL